jgi:hypothetical protein
VKYVTLDLAHGNLRSIINFTTNHLDKIGCNRVYERPIDEFYLVICPVQNLSWWAKEDMQFDNDVLNDVRNKKAGLILSSGVDSFSSKAGSKGRRSRPYAGKYSFPVIPDYRGRTDIVTFIKKTADRLEVPTDCIVYIDSNYKVEKLLKQFNLKGVWFNWSETYYEPLETDHLKQNIINKKSRKKKFLFLGGKPREFRLQFVSELLKISNFATESFVSSGKGTYVDFFTRETKFIDTIKLDYSDVDNLPDRDAILIPLEFFGDSYINIVPMSYIFLNHNQVEVSEKIFKPIISLQPFIILGEVKTLEVLHELGYKTFDKWIDESYDNIIDDRERFIKVLNEVKRINNFTHTQLNDMLLEMLPVLEYNQALRTKRYMDKEPILLNKIMKAFDRS